MRRGEWGPVRHLRLTHYARLDGAGAGAGLIPKRSAARTAPPSTAVRRAPVPVRHRLAASGLVHRPLRGGAPVLRDPQAGDRAAVKVAGRSAGAGARLTSRWQMQAAVSRRSWAIAVVRCGQV